MVGLTLDVSEYCPVPVSGRRCACAGTSSAPLRWPTQRKRTHAPKTHLELHDRLADHREQPRRQREQLRREVRVRHTGGGRWMRLPVPREQHRHEQLQPLQQRIRSFTRALEPAKEGGKEPSDDSGSAFLAACCPVAAYPWSA